MSADVKQDKKSFFAYVRSKAKCKVTAGPLKNVQGDILQTTEENVEELNICFASVFTKENMDNVPTRMSEASNKVGLADIEITEEKVMKKLEKLRHDKAGGADEQAADHDKKGD